MPTALLIIDVQNIMCSGRYKAHAIDAVITRINMVSRKARNAGAMVIVVQHETQNGVMDYEAESWKLAPQLEVQASDVLLRKTASDAFLRTELQELLASRGIDKLIVCGVQSDFCVDSTVRRAMALGYPVTLVEDGHTTLDNGILSASQISQHHNKTLSSLESYGPRTTLVSAAEIHIDPRGADAPIVSWHHVAMARLEGTRLILAVRNLRIATDFYVNALGFQRDFGDESDGWSWLSRDNVRVGLGECADAMPASELGDHSYVAYVSVDDIDGLYGEFVSRGVPIRMPPATKPWGMREFALQTPDGHRLTFGSTVRK